MDQDSSESERAQTVTDVEPDLPRLPCFGKERVYRSIVVKNSRQMLLVRRVPVSDETRRLRQIWVRNLILRVLKTHNHDELFL